MSKKTWRYPTAPDGSIPHWAVDRGVDTPQVTWHDDPDSWELHGVHLTLDGMRSGRSAKYVIWRDVNGRQFPMFITDLLDLITRGEVHKGTTTETMRVVKRGQNFGIALR